MKETPASECMLFGIGEMLVSRVATFDLQQHLEPTKMRSGEINKGSQPRMQASIVRLSHVNAHHRKYPRMFAMDRKTRRVDH
jgi:hypothetical protein